MYIKLILGFWIFSVQLLMAQTWGDPVVLINQFEENQWEKQSFRVDDEMTVKIDAVIPVVDEEPIALFWLLDSESRDLVWKVDRTDVSSKDYNFVTIQNQVVLRKGSYEAYAGILCFEQEVNEHDKGLFDELMAGLKLKSKKDNFYLKITPYKSNQDQCYPLKNFITSRPGIQLTKVGDDQSLKSLFVVKKTIKAEIYMLGEAQRSDRDLFDYGVILNTKTRKIVWQPQSGQGRYAGGSRKNRVFREIISIPPGEYELTFITDDSHSFEEFNDCIPYDPEYWGITLWFSPKDMKFVEFLNNKEIIDKTIIKITNVQDNAFIKKGFELLKDTRVRIYALGEQVKHSKQFSDHGWIVNAGTHETVWSMNRNNTVHAGGAKKNRMADQIIELPAGAYYLYYRSDDSHAYNQWNDAPPVDSEFWGISLFPADSSFVPDDVISYVKENDPNYIASITKIGDNEKRQKQFTVSQNLPILIYALGEGEQMEMYDYGWIEDSKGTVVWKMEYQNTTSAGGAQKNRLCKDQINLHVGDYVLYYISDDSHSFEDWNACEPDNPDSWGITLYYKN